MTRFSLIIPTVGRTEELGKMLGSLADQHPTDFEVIIVDQNEDDRVDRLVNELGDDMKVCHVRMGTKSLSLARNVGLDRASGEIVAFPDDDCWYPSCLLSKIDHWFNANPQYDILAVGANDVEGLPSGNRWFQDRCDIRSINVLRTTFANTLFLRRKAFSQPVRFDESLSASEETDYILKLMKAGHRGRFDRTLFVGHPRRDMLSGTVTRSRAHKYGHGMGQLVRRHSLSALWVALLGYDVLRLIAVSLKGNFSNARFCLAHAQGLFQGYVYAKPRQY